MDEWCEKGDAALLPSFTRSPTVTKGVAKELRPLFPVSCRLIATTIG
jgi:hypothetical protein